MMMRLTHTRPDGEVDTYHLKPGRKYHLGRGSMCEVRILDLKLSRKHCVIEHGPRGWQVEDLASTNGCKVNGEQIVGPAPLFVGSTIAIGQSTLGVASLIDPNDAGENSGASIAAENAARANRTPTPRPPSDPSLSARKTPLAVSAKPVTPPMPTPRPPPQQEELPAGENEAHQKKPTVELDAHAWEPQPETDSHVDTGPLLPLTANGDLDTVDTDRQPAVPRKPVISARPEPAVLDLEADAPRREAKPAVAPEFVTPAPIRAAPEPISAAPEPTIPDPFAPAPAATAPATSEPPRPRGPMPIKPVTIRVGAAADPTPGANTALNMTPAQGSPTQASSPAAGGDERTFAITVLGRRIGPLTRAEARDLKARELKGTLTEDDIAAYPKL